MKRFKIDWAGRLGTVLIMSAISAALALGAFSLNAARAQSNTGLQYVPLGYCQLTSLSASTLLSSCTNFPANATQALITVESQAVRIRDDGTAPTASVGMPIAVGLLPYNYIGNLKAVRIIEQTASAKVNVLFYK